MLIVIYGSVHDGIGQMLTKNAQIPLNNLDAPTPTPLTIPFHPTNAPLKVIDHVSGNISSAPGYDFCSLIHLFCRNVGRIHCLVSAS
jgi:hypothetical protein